MMLQMKTADQSIFLSFKIYLDYSDEIFLLHGLLEQYKVHVFD